MSESPVLLVSAARTREGERADSWAYETTRWLTDVTLVFWGDRGKTRMTKHWTLKLATLVLGVGMIGAMAVPIAQGVTVRTVWDGVYSEAQAARGKAVYDAQCAFCHQSDLRGQGFAPGLIEDTFTSRWRDGNL